jgi:hypothetical protein
VKGTGKIRVKGRKGIKERKQESDRLKYEINHSPLNFNGLFTLVACYYDILL